MTTIIKKSINLILQNEPIIVPTDTVYGLVCRYDSQSAVEKIQWSINKIVNLRIFADKEDKMNLSLTDVSGEIMAISNFTLPADLNESGRRPSFTKSAKPELAEGLYNQFIEECKKQNIKIACGKFGAMMDIESVADGPVNLILKK